MGRAEYIDGRTLSVTGQAWFDHQWGDFIAVGGGGWDWFAINLDDDTDVTLSLVRDADGSYPLIYGTLVRADGKLVYPVEDGIPKMLADESIDVPASCLSANAGTRGNAGS